MALSNVADLVEDIRQGKMVILMDDEGRENEGDLIIAAEAVTAETINFYSSEACGLICLTITPEQAQRLKLPLMVRDNRSQHEPISLSPSTLPTNWDRASAPYSGPTRCARR